MDRNQPLWRPPQPRSRLSLPSALEGWLLGTDSLTHRLRSICGDGFRVQVLRQGWALPCLDERRQLGMAGREWALIREVHLYCREAPVVFARTVIPRRALSGAGRRLASLGSRPLGAVLFADVQVRRGPVEIARIAPRHALYRRALPGGGDGEAIWGRRSLFSRDAAALMVSEIFLPPLFRRGSAGAAPGRGDVPG